MLQKHAVFRGLATLFLLRLHAILPSVVCLLLLLAVSLRCPSLDSSPLLRAGPFTWRSRNVRSASTQRDSDPSSQIGGLFARVPISPANRGPHLGPDYAIEGVASWKLISTNLLAAGLAVVRLAAAAEAASPGGVSTNVAATASSSRSAATGGLTALSHFGGDKNAYGESETEQTALFDSFILPFFGFNI
ncbi:unnamed protein product [Protopolystoma xenopodis]|uniref:Uncharacterized protein n=1 Tax=Protopolystoma xenopodis TaxID=117903 RepID=A0A448WNP9_9PLAT|nr:unnamed protein product [Protopolystoma xenopodis]